MIVTLNPLEIPNFSCYFHTPYSKTILYSRIAVNFARTLSFFLQIASSASFSVWAALISSSLAAIPAFAWVLTVLSPSIAVLKAFKTLSTFFDRSTDVVPFELNMFSSFKKLILWESIYIPPPIIEAPNGYDPFSWGYKAHILPNELRSHYFI